MVQPLLHLGLQARVRPDRRERVEFHARRGRVGLQLLLDRGLVAGLRDLDLVDVGLADRIRAGLPRRVADEDDAPGGHVALDLVRPVRDDVLALGAAARQVVQAFDRRGREGVQLQHVREVAGRVDQVVGDRLARGLHTRDLVGVDVLLDGRDRGGRDLGEPGAELLVADDQRLEVRQPAERLGRVAVPLEAEQRVSRRDLPGRGGVPVGAGADRHGVRLAAVADGRQRGGEVRHDRGGLARGGRVRIQQPEPGPLAQGADRVVGDVVVHEVNVALAEHVERAALFGRPGAGVHSLETEGPRARRRAAATATAAATAAAATGGSHEREGSHDHGGRIAPRAYAHRHIPPSRCSAAKFVRGA